MSSKKDPEVQQPEILDIPSAPATDQLARYAPQNNDISITAVFDVKMLNKRLDELKTFVKSYLVEGEDFGVIPGTPKPTLLKPGADKLCDIYGLSDDYVCTNRVEDWDRGLFDFEFKCVLTSRRTGRFVGSGVGSCSSFEVKYRYRDAKRSCPNCGKPTIIKGKEEFGGGFICWKKEGKSDGCGAKFSDSDERITSQIVGKVANEDPAEQKNTILKMAKKRAKVDAVISVTRSSSLFTQDLEDSPRDDGEKSNKPPVSTGTRTGPAAAPAQQSARPAPTTAKPASTQAAKPTQSAPAATAQAAAPAQAPAAAPKAAVKVKSRSQRAQEIAAIINSNTTLLMTFLCKHLGCDSETIRQVPAKVIDATFTAIESCLKKFPASSVGDLIRDDERVLPALKAHFLESYANLTKE
jgi:hypothetical protein